MAIKQEQKAAIIQLLQRHNIPHRLAGKVLYLKTSNYIALADEVTAALVTLTHRYGYIIQMEG